MKLFKPERKTKQAGIITSEERAFGFTEQGKGENISVSSKPNRIKQAAVKVLQKTATGATTVDAWTTPETLILFEAVDRNEKLSPQEKKKAKKLIVSWRQGRNGEIFLRRCGEATNSFVMGQVPWYVIMPGVSQAFPGIRKSPLRWVMWGLDKLFVNAKSNLYETPGVSWENASIVADNVTKQFGNNKGVGMSLYGLELATDLSRILIEYWSQKKYGAIADLWAYAFGQDRAPFFRYSNLEAVQKIMNLAANPDVLGTTEQYRSSIGGIGGSLFRTGPQLGAIVLAMTLVKKYNLDRYTPSGVVKTGVDAAIGGNLELAMKRRIKAEKELKSIFGENWDALKLQVQAERANTNPFHLVRPNKIFARNSDGKISVNPYAAYYKPPVEFESAKLLVEARRELEELQRIMGGRDARSGENAEVQGRLVYARDLLVKATGKKNAPWLRKFNTLQNSTNFAPDRNRELLEILGRIYHQSSFGFEPISGLHTGMGEAERLREAVGYDPGNGFVEAEMRLAAAKDLIERPMREMNSEELQHRHVWVKGHLAAAGHLIDFARENNTPNVKKLVVQKRNIEKAMAKQRLNFG